MISVYLNIVQMDGTLSGSPPESNHVDQEAEQRGSSRAAARLIASWLMSNERKWIHAYTSMYTIKQPRFLLGIRRPSVLT